MAAKHRASVIDGFTVLKAIRVGDQERGAVAPRKEFADRVRHTALPSLNEVICYRCKHVFEFRGALRNTQCPKCRIFLKKTDHTIEGQWDKNIETIGVIHITPTAILKGGCRLVGRDIVLEGTIEEGTVYACRCLVLKRGARFELSNLEAKDFVVVDGATISLPNKKIRCRNVEISGELRTKLYADGKVVVRAGGLLKGEIHSDHLVVEDGGGLAARMFISTRTGGRP